MLFFLYLSSILSYACLGREGAYVIKIKIYLDEDSFSSISRFSHHLIHHGVFEAKKHPFSTSALFYVKKYFGLIFDEINAQFKDSDIQFKADYSDLLKGPYKNMKQKYCVEMNNILAITETFSAELPNRRKSGQNSILIINCKGNHPFMPTMDHMAYRNQCGTVHGILMMDPSELRKVVLDGIYSIFKEKAISKVFGANARLIDNACRYVHQCNRYYPDTGYFVKDLKSIGHNNDLTEFQRVKNRIWSFGGGLVDDRPIDVGTSQDYGI